MYSTLSKLFMVPVYQTVAEYENATGRKAPVYDPTKRVKCWSVDPMAFPKDESGFVSFSTLAHRVTESGGPTAKMWPMVNASGDPYLTTYRIPAAEAYNVNIPIKDFTGRVPESPQYLGEWPAPMSVEKLGPDEKISFLPGMPGLVGIVKTIKPVVGQTGEPVDLTPVIDYLKRLDNRLDSLEAMLKLALRIP